MADSFKAFSSALQIAFWVVLFSIIMYVSTANTTDVKNAVERVVLVFVCHITIFYACYSLIIPRYFEHKKYVATALFFLLLFLILTPLRIIIERHFADTHVFAINLHRKNGVGFSLIMFSEIAVGAFACLVRLAASSFMNRQKMEAMRTMQLESELKFLKAQMSPHFLFNTINNIYSLTLLKSDKAPKFLLKLSALLRYLLYECDKQVTYSQEEKALKIYTELFELRFDEPLNIKTEFNVQQTDKLIESMLLIPILENAFKYSGLGINNYAFVNFKIYEVNNKLQVVCENSIAPNKISNEPGGIGLTNINKRLEMGYANQYKLDIAEANNVFILTLTIPMI